MRERTKHKEDASELKPLTVDSQDSVRKSRHSGPRSKIVEAIAIMLLAKPMRAAEIAQALGYPTRYISSYLSYWRTRGLFEYENGYWQLTPQGEEYARQILEREMASRTKQYIALAQTILRSTEAKQVSSAINYKTVSEVKKSSEKLLSFIAELNNYRSKKQQKSKLKCMLSIVNMLQLEDDERDVLEFLVRHYGEWGSTYLYLDQLEQQLDADRAWLLNVLRRLQTKKLIYIYNDKRLGVRIGLTKKLRESLDLCE